MIVAHHHRIASSYRRAWLFLVAMSVASPFFAAEILRNDGLEPTRGVVLKATDQQVTVQVMASDGTRRDVVVPRKAIQTIVPTVDPVRLAALDPAQPAEYRDYAEELAAKARDGEARLMAIHLYTLAFHLDRPNLGVSALRGMIPVARSPDEADHFRQALYLVDNTQTLADYLQQRTPITKSNSPGLGQLLAAVRAIRQGHGSAQLVTLQSPAVVAEAKNWGHILTLSELTASAQARSLSEARLRQLLILELELERVGTSLLSSADSLTWGDALQGDRVVPPPRLDLEQLTEFDPQLPYFRNGKWVAAP